VLAGLAMLACLGGLPGGVRAATIYVTQTGSDANSGLSWSEAKGTVAGGLAAAVAGDEVWVAAGVYVERITLKAGAALYGGFAGSETQLEQRSVASNPTVLDGNRTGNVVTSPSGATATTRIDGFTIRNGYVSNGYGGGIYCSSSSPTIANCTITGNDALYGGGVHCVAASPMIANTIVAFNSSGINTVGSGTPVLRHNCVYGNTSSNYYGLIDPTGTDDNISADPKLAGPAFGNVHLQPDSPCRDAGDNSLVQADWLDIDGQARIQGSHVDIGADESDGTAWPAGPYAVIRVAPEGDDANDGSSWELAKRTVQAGIDAATGGEVWVKAGVYLERVALPAYVYLYGGFTGTETQRDQRNWAAYPTILDGQAGGSVVTVRGGVGVNALDGFTIRNGRTNTGGGGIDCFCSSPTIANCTITGNSATYYGGGIYWGESSPTIVNCTITGNQASSGGGLCCEYDSAVITNCTIAGNIASSGGGIYCRYSRSTIANTIVAFNSSGIHGTAFLIPVLWHNCVYGNTAYNYSGLTDPTGTNGNISADPLFVRHPHDGGDGWGTGDNDDYGNLRLLAGSPCIDAGNNVALPADAADLDGDGDTSEPLPFDAAGRARLVDDPAKADTGAGTPPIVDIGAYEAFPTVRADFSRDGYVDAEDLEMFEACATGPMVFYDPAALPGPLPGCSLTPGGDGRIAADFDRDGDVDQDDFGIFQRCYGTEAGPAQDCDAQ